ncbi:MAG TPA: homoserine kinase [Longilinea sp.]|nr:homoserine kinase [Longilinea sp.]
MTLGVRVRVPATTANLGPGFDCLGLALDLWNEVDIRLIGNELKISNEGEGAGILPANAKNAIFRAMKALADQKDIPLPAGIQITSRNAIPLGSGLGSSAAAVLAGIFSAGSLFDVKLSFQEQLDLAAELEGHPDNVAPCLLGGLTACMQTEHGVVVRSLPLKEMPILIALPDFNFSTRVARSVLPKLVPYKDAVFNISHTLMVTQALQEGDFDLLKEAMQDRLHQPYRLPLIPGAQQAMEAAYRAGAATVALSGAGPALLVVCRYTEDRETVAGVMRTQFEQAGLAMRYFLPGIAFKGVETKIIHE